MSAVLVLAATPLITGMVVLTAQAGEYLLGMMAVMAVYMIGRCINTVVINGVLDGGGDTLFVHMQQIKSRTTAATELAAAASVPICPIIAEYEVKPIYDRALYQYRCDKRRTGWGRGYSV